MSFFRTLLMFVFVFSLVGVSGSYAGKIKNCSNCVKKQPLDNVTWCVDEGWSDKSSLWRFPYWVPEVCKLRDKIISENEVISRIKNIETFKKRYCEYIGGENTVFLKPYFSLQKKYSINCKKSAPKSDLASLSDYLVCYRMVALANGSPEYKFYKEDQLRIKPYIEEAKRRGLDCGVKEDNKTVIASNQTKDPNKRPLASVSDTSVCYNATTSSGGKKVWNDRNDNFVGEARYRGLDCGVKGEFKQNNIANILKPLENKPRKHFEMVVKLLKKYPEKKREISNELKLQASFLAAEDHHEFVNRAEDISFVLSNLIWKELDSKTTAKLIFLFYTDYQYYQKIVMDKNVLDNMSKIPFSDNLFTNLVRQKLRRNGNTDGRIALKYLKEKIFVDCNALKFALENRQLIEDRELPDNAQRIGLSCNGKQENKTIIASKPKNTKPSISSAELDAERQKRLQLERELAEIKNKQKQEQQRINTDNQEPIINVFSKQNGSNAIVSGRVTDNIEIAEVLVDGQVQKLKSNGTFETELYVPRSGLNVEIVAYDKKGNKASKLLKLERGNIQQSSGPSFDRLNPSGKRVKSNPNALALIIGVADYEKTKADALYADKDAQQFYDYATMKLGIPARNVKELVNNKADRVEIGLAIQDWIARSTKQGKTDIYVFFAGHGLASQDGKDMFLLPYDGSPRLLKASAIRRKELFANIKQANPRSVTVFLDTCYSGVTRNEEMLIAGRPIVIKAKEQAIPDGFTLFSAASNEQISRPLEEAKHGMFSYFLMKGMEGDADANNDNKITARELHAYVEQNVVQQSSGSQTPELQGDKDRVLVQFN